ncbi:MAG: ectoine synthase [Pirellulaceae bacterium]
MIVRRLEEISGSDREISGPTWKSRRLLLAGDAMGFSLHDTVMRAELRRKWNTRTI